MPRRRRGRADHLEKDLDLARETLKGVSRERDEFRLEKERLEREKAALAAEMDTEVK